MCRCRSGFTPAALTSVLGEKAGEMELHFAAL